MLRKWSRVVVHVFNFDSHIHWCRVQRRRRTCGQWRTSSAQCALRGNNLAQRFSMEHIITPRDSVCSGAQQQRLQHSGEDSHPLKPCCLLCMTDTAVGQRGRVCGAGHAADVGRQRTRGSEPRLRRRPAARAGCAAGLPHHSVTQCCSRRKRCVLLAFSAHAGRRTADLTTTDAEISVWRLGAVHVSCCATWIRKIPGYPRSRFYSASVVVKHLPATTALRSAGNSLPTHVIVSTVVAKWRSS